MTAPAKTTEAYDTTQTHKLVGDTLYIERGGIVAKCTCGWRSREHFTMLTAASAFEYHKENAG